VRYRGSYRRWLCCKPLLTEQKELALSIDKALPMKLWEPLMRVDGILERPSAKKFFAPGRGISPCANEAVARATWYRLALAPNPLPVYFGAAYITRGKLRLMPERDSDAESL
jgi:hypothetical protein